MSIQTTMYDEAKREFEEVSGFELGSEQHTKTIQAANSVVDRLNELDKIENEKRKLDIEEQRLEIEKAKLKNDKQDHLIRDIITVGLNVLFVGVTIWANVDAKRFEQGFTHTTEAGRSSTKSLLGLFKPKI